MADKTFTFLVIFSIFLLQVAGEAFPTIIIQQNDGVFPDVINATGTVSVASPSGTSFISVKVPPEADQMAADQIKRYNDAGKPIDNDEILPGYSKEKRQHNTCHLTCTLTHLVDICQGAPVFASCGDDYTLEVGPPVLPPGGNGVGRLDGTNTDPNAEANEDKDICLRHCNCYGGHGKQAETSGLSKSIADTDDTDNVPTIKSISDENGDAAPDTIIRAGAEIYKPLLEASTGSTAIPVNNEEQVLTTDIMLLPEPEEEPSPSFDSWLLSRERPSVPAAGGWVPRAGNTPRKPDSSIEDEGTAIEYDFDEVDDVQADLEDEDSEAGFFTILYGC